MCPEPHPEAGQLWLRDHALAPWFLDCILSRAKDNADLAVAWPLLAAEQQEWLRSAVHKTQPDHPWLTGVLAE